MTLSDQLWGHWHFEETTGNRLDASVNHRDLSQALIYTNTVQIGSDTGKINNAVQSILTSGTGHLDALRITSQTLSMSSGCAICFWFKQHTGGAGAGFEVFLGSLAGHNVGIISTSTGANAIPVTVSVDFISNINTSALTADAWHLLIANLTPAGLRVLVDNVLEVNDPTLTPVPDNVSNTFYLTAFSLNTVGEYIDFDEAAVWERPLTTQEEIDLWNGGAGLETFPGGIVPLAMTGSDPLASWADTIGISMTSGYMYETFAALKLQLANRLHDPSKIFWTDTELAAILTETLRTFSFFTWHWRDRGSFNTVAGTTFYDLTSQLPTLLARTVTDRNLINDIEYHFQEPATSAWAGGWTGTAMFTMDDIAHALQKRRNKFLVDTGVVITRLTQNFGVSALGRISLPDSFIDVRRLARTSAAGVITNLWRLDEEEVTSYLSTWPTPAAQDPSFYSILATPPLTVQLAPAPTAAAVMDILYVSTGSDFIPTFAATLAGVPDDMAWIVKWGAMADLLQKDGPAQDPERAAYCEHRYQHGVQLARMTAVITAAKIGSSQVMVWPLADLDAYQIGWQSATAATPTILATAGLNYVALSPPPSGATAITLDVIKNAPIPASDSENVQIGREMISTILDYAEHLAMFKVGGDEWKSTDQLLTQFMTMCGNYNARMNAASKIWNELRNVTNAEEPTRLRLRKLDKGVQQ